MLRRHYATRSLRKLLRPMCNAHEKSQQVELWVPSKWSAAIAVLTWSVLPRVGTGLPLIGYWPLALALAVAIYFELEILPRISLARYRFRLMRLEATYDDQEFSELYTTARVAAGTTGFGVVTWKSVRGVEPGDIVVAVADAGNRGVALIPLRTEGKLPVAAWLRDLYQENVLPPLAAEVKALAQAFDEACDRYARIAPQAERSRALRSNKVMPKERDPELAWANVAVSDDLKRRLLALTKDFAQGNASASHGLLLYGPPGTGKTLIARTVADSMGCAFFPLSLVDLKAGHIGQSGQRVKELWSKALAQPRAVVFVDECEAVFGRRGGVNTDSFVEEVVTAFLAQWEGFTKQTSVWVMGATNRRDLIDPAILSRFDDQIEIGLPDGGGRLEILGKELATLGHASALPRQTALLTQGLSGRDLASLAKRLVREAGANTSVTDAMLERLTAAFRKQGSTATDASARWDTLVLPEPTLKDLKTTAGLLKNAGAFQQRGIAVPRGLLLFGPPGTGKTQIARTLANETGLRFIAASTADIKQGFLGQSGQKVRELFERAREAAPSLLFIDEIDIVARVRGGHHDSFATEIVGQLLQEMDGAKVHGQHVFVLAATNRLDQIDEAVLSRLSKRIEIPFPDQEGVERLLNVMLSGKPVDFERKSGAALLAARLTGKSGRDLRNWVELAEQNAVARAIEAGDANSAAISLKDFGNLGEKAATQASAAPRDDDAEMDGGQDVLGSYEDGAIEEFRFDGQFIEKLRRNGMPWRSVQERLKDALPDLLSDRAKIAYGLVPKAMNAVFGQRGAAWKTEKRPSKSGSGFTTWIVALR